LSNFWGSKNHLFMHFSYNQGRTSRNEWFVGFIIKPIVLCLTGNKHADVQDKRGLIEFIFATDK